MGFFRLGNSQNQYLGIWYKKISVKTIVWVANREIPLINLSGVLMIIDLGILAFINGTGTVIWSVNVTGSTQNPIGQFMDTGNLVVKDANDKSEHFLWQSFDYPCDTHLPGMKLGKNFEVGLERHLSSWKSIDDLARGEYTYLLDPQGYPQCILKNGSVELFRTGPWNGLRFSGRPNLKPNPYYTYGLVYSEEEVYYHCELINPVVSRYGVSYEGIVKRLLWVDQTQKWDTYLTAPTDNCDNYRLCGPNGSCNIGNSSACGCLSKFVPRNETEWGNGDYSKGCVRRTPLDCHSGEGFLKSSWPQLEEDKEDYSHLSSLNSNTYAWPSFSLYILKKKGWRKREGRTKLQHGHAYYKETKNEDLDLPLFHLATITKATDNFAIDNKIREGGFGLVYMGMLEGGLEIFVKLLSRNSQQGVDEFKNEVICIAKLQHRNLVKLLGYCIQGEERSLIYEYMLNNTLDSFIFDQSKKLLLDWPKCFHIINGIARGLLYLHQDSRFRIIHRDLKGSNILLNHEMNPKISDFGLARIFGGNETIANTKRVVRKLGYMSPEYAIEALFSVKSDVFSFGVIVLEVVSGK
ncbi:hypothetical protein TEA_025692 [Camellia sinensis var. sinensis]|uniref:non-specific serine/threonine protein kinase n=1 Tax=Camellia sinensis var. sinensis TaxID=542762 RepID=A0A4S4D7K9_CAMSN|nr:hypothetical protein TEA_025692 [Camellia sinensis var. sinensis]